MSELARPAGVAFRPVVAATPISISLPQPAATPALDLVRASDPAKSREIDCRSAIGPELAASARAVAYAVTTDNSNPALYDKVRTNAVALRQLGIDTLEDSNRVINELFDNENFDDLEEATKLLRDLRKDMKKLTTKFNPGDPKILEFYQKWQPNIADKLRGIKSVGQLIMIDIAPLKSQMKAIENEAEHQLKTVDEILAYYDQMLKLTENEVVNLMYAIAVMEFLLERAHNELEAMPANDPSKPFNNERDRLARFIRDLDTKVNDFKAKLWLSVANAPRIMDMQSITQSVALRLVAINQLVIPSMKSAIVDWSKTAKAVSAARFIGEVTETFNEVLQASAQATSAAVPIMLSATETPLLTVESVYALGKMYDDVVAAVETEIALGTERKAELRKAEAEVLGQILDDKQKISDVYIKAALDAGNVKPIEGLATPNDLALPAA
jgi:uncharacterized protein YaaN involved in tellurite resistance